MPVLCRIVVIRVCVLLCLFLYACYLCCLCCCFCLRSAFVCCGFVCCLCFMRVHLGLLVFFLRYVFEQCIVCAASSLFVCVCVCVVIVCLL